MGLAYAVLQVIPYHPEKEEREFFGVLKTATGSCMAAYGILYVWYLLCIGKLNEVIFKTGLRKMQVDLFCKKIVLNFHFTLNDYSYLFHLKLPIRN